MQKIPTLFERDLTTQPALLIPTVVQGLEWVAGGEGTPTRKYDGTCVMLDGAGLWWTRREVKPGKSAPAGFVAVQDDPATGKTVGWEPASQSAPACPTCGWRHEPTATEVVEITRRQQWAARGRTVRYAWQYVYTVRVDGHKFTGKGIAWARDCARRHGNGRPVVLAWEV